MNHANLRQNPHAAEHACTHEVCGRIIVRDSERWSFRESDPVLSGGIARRSR